MQYWTCSLCGANLDSGEKCDCEEKSRQQKDFYLHKMKAAKNGQFMFQWKNQKTEAYQR
ncbi:MAG: hypothetical protein K1W19_10405 [Lachnospiraceae bacterium]